MKPQPPDGFARPGFIAPEVVLGDGFLEEGDDPGAPDHRVDFFSLGVTFYLALSFRYPFAAYENAEQLVHAVAQPPERLHELRDDVGEEWTHVLNKLFVPYRELRYANADELVEDARLLRDGLDERPRHPTNAQIPDALEGHQPKRAPTPSPASMSEHAFARARSLERLGEIMRSYEGMELPTLASRGRSSDTPISSGSWPGLGPPSKPESGPLPAPRMIATKTGRIGLHFVEPNSVLIVVRGHLHENLVLDYITHIRAGFERFGSVALIQHWGAMTGYDSGARKRLTDFAVAYRTRFTLLHNYATQTIVQMGLHVANTFVKTINSHSTEASFLGAIERDLGKAARQAVSDLHSLVERG